MGDPEQPRREARRVIEFPQVLIGFQEHVLAKIKRIFTIRNQPQQIIENALLPAGHEEVITLHISASRFGDQVAIFDLAKDQLLAPFVKTPRRAEKSDFLINYDASPPQVP